MIRNRWSTLNGQPLAVLPSTQLFFYGRITREEAENILHTCGNKSGLYLLRESTAAIDDYALSVCHNNNIHHYAIQKSFNGMYKISSGKEFVGPVELLNHHKENVDGLVTVLKIPCERSNHQPIIAFRGMTHVDLEREIEALATKKKIRQEDLVGVKRQQVVLKVIKGLHTKQPWFHGKISREDATKQITGSAYKEDGYFLVRSKDERTFALTLMYCQEPRHYIIEENLDKLGIPEGPRFDCLIMLVNHYHNKSDGLLCKLTRPCPARGFNEKKLKEYESNIEKLNDVYQSFTTTSDRSSSASLRSPISCRGSNRFGDDPLPPIPDEKRSESIRRRLPPVPDTCMQNELLEKIYDDVPYHKDLFNLQVSQIQIEKDLGSGQFGTVQKGNCTLKDGKNIPVAIKTLKKEDTAASEEIMKEAEFMGKLQHKHIVRMIGLCKSENIMLVLELAPLGPLNSYLKGNKGVTPQWNICELMCQVAEGMKYLSHNSFVHRDLAARNVLLQTEHSAKISDFGMSKSLGKDSNYYTASESGKWPLKWYAPECVYYWKFDSKSDVWSYGVTLWEATSYGEKPYRKMKGQEVLSFIEGGERLPKPVKCDEEVYHVMLKCWQINKQVRPTFAELATMMEQHWKRLREIPDC